MHKSRLNFTQKTNILFYLMSQELGTFGPEILWAFQDNPLTPKKTKQQKKTDALHLTNSSPTYVPYPNQHK